MHNPVFPQEVMYIPRFTGGIYAAWIHQSKINTSASELPNASGRYIE